MYVNYFNFNDFGDYGDEHGHFHDYDDVLNKASELFKEDEAFVQAFGTRNAQLRTVASNTNEGRFFSKTGEPMLNSNLNSITDTFDIFVNLDFNAEVVGGGLSQINNGSTNNIGTFTFFIPTTNFNGTGLFLASFSDFRLLQVVR